MYWASLGIFKVHIKQPRQTYHSASACQILSNRTVRDRVMTSYPFQDGGHGIAILLPLSVFVISLTREGRNLPAYQISARYLNPRLRYYYFRFLKTDVRHVGILFLVPIFTLRHHRHVILYLSTKFRPNGLSATELWRHIHFSRWRPSAILNYFKVTADYPRSANGGPRSVLKFSEIMLFLCYEFLAWICYLHGCIRRVCTEWGVNVLPG